MKEQQRQFRGVWIPKEIWLNKELTQQEKMILIEIDSLEDEEKGCWASNKHFNSMFDISNSRISQIIQSLQNKGYIRIEYEKKGKEILARHLFINRPPYPNKLGMLKTNIGVCQFSKGGYVKKLKENNTLSNNTNNNNIIYIVEYLNEKADKNFKHTTNKTRTLINARLNEGFTKEDFIKVIDTKVREWINDKKMNQYLRPETLFGTKFEGYLNQNEIKSNVPEWFDKEQQVQLATEDEQKELENLLKNYK